MLISIIQSCQILEGIYAKLSQYIIVNSMED